MRSPWFSYYFSREISIESQYLFQKAQMSAGEGRDEEAVRYLQQAVIMSPRFSKAFYEMGHCYVRLSQYARASEVYHRAAKIDPLMNDEVARRLDGINSRTNSGAGAAAR